MASVPRTKQPQRAEEPAPSALDVRQAVAHVLGSQPFRTSKQCQDLLRYIVDRSLSGDDASLRERVIGAEVFGRKPTYDTGDDPVVRVRAADVRKRLAQYYQSVEQEDVNLYIELQPGSYLAHFRLHPPARATQLPAAVVTPEVVQLPNPVKPVAPPGSLRPRDRSKLTLLIALAIVAIASILGGIRLSWKSPQQQFWAPFVAGKQPPLLYLGSNSVYVFTPEYLHKYSAVHGLANNGLEFFPDLPANGTVRVSDLVPVPDTFVTTGDVAASVQLASLVAGWKRPFVLRSGRDLAFGDLRNRPSLMIGAFNNPWTLELTRNLPYSFRQGARIQDRDHPEKVWAASLRSDIDTSDDYALISRLPVSGTGGPLMTIAGIGQFGTQAAAEFVASPDRMRDLLKSAPRDWQNKNMQAVLHIKVVGYTPVQVDVVETRYW